MRSPTYRLVQQVLRFVGEAAWIYAWSAVLGHWLGPSVGPALPLWLLSVCLLVAAGARERGHPAVGEPPGCPSPRRSSASRSPSAPACSPPRSLADGLDASTLARTAVGSQAFVAGTLALVAWWRGSRLGSNGPSLYEVEGQFRFGVLAIAGLLALIAVLGAGAAPEARALVGPALALVASGLLGVPLARIAEVSR